MNPGPRLQMSRPTRRCDLRMASGRVCNATDDVQAIQLRQRNGRDFDTQTHYACAPCRASLGADYRLLR